MAEHSHPVILPVSLETKGYRIRAFKRITLTYGKPIPYGEYGALLEEEGRAALTKKVFLEICAMADESRAEREGKKKKKKKQERDAG